MLSVAEKASWKNDTLHLMYLREVNISLKIDARGRHFISNLSKQNVSVLWLPLYCHPFEHLMELSLFADISENKLETLYEWFCRVNKTQA